jgi:CBS domain-containing protein
VREVARFDLVTVAPDAELFDALLIMLRHRVHRVLVKEGDTIVGVLSQLDLMSFMSNHSHLIMLQVEQARSVAELQVAALQVDDTIKLLQRGGMRIEIISRLVSELNSQIFARLWALVAPPELVHNSCLLVMGSEGRSEQILKTDQDNALLRYQLTFTVNGPYRAIKQFVHTLEQSPRLIIIQQVGLQGADQPGGSDVRLQLNLDTFFRPGTS